MGVIQAFALTDRKPLHELLPLPQPLAVYIGTNDNCNFACKFCYRSITEYEQRPNISMDFFKKLIADLSDFEQPVKTLYLGEFAEPLMHPQFTEFVKIAKDSKVAEVIKMSTNASFLTPELSHRLISAGMDVIQISINGMSDEHYKQVVNRNISFNKIRDNIAYLYSVKGNARIHVKCIGDYFSDEQKEKFLEVFTPICDSIYIEAAANQWLDLEIETKSDSNRFGLKNIKESAICSRPFYMMAIHQNGKVVVCPVNHKMTFTVGDANNESLKDIWNGKALYDLRMSILQGSFREKYPDCSKCNFTEFQSSEDLTPYREDLIRIYER